MATALSGGVKALFDAGISKLPQEYIQASEVFDKLGDDEVPVLDLLKDDLELHRHALTDGCQNWGLFQVVGHGIPAEVMHGMRNSVSQFFDLSAEERATYCSDGKTFKVGTSHNSTTEKTMHWHDYMYQVCYPPPIEHELPNNVPNYRKITSDYCNHVDKLVMKLLEMFGKHLCLEPGVLEAKIASPWRYTMRMNYYPPCPDPASTIGLGKHSDVGTLTVLQQDDDIEGLQVMNNDRWVTVKPRPGALVIIVGDQLQLLTNGKYKSTEHRAIVNISKPRISIVSFILPTFDTFVSPLDELVVAGPQVYKGITFGAYYKVYFDYLYSGKRMLDTVKL